MTSLEQTDQDDCEPARLSPVDTRRPRNQSAGCLPGRKRGLVQEPLVAALVFHCGLCYTHTKKTSGIKTLPSQPARKWRTQFPGGVKQATGPRLQQVFRSL